MHRDIGRYAIILCKRPYEVEGVEREETPRNPPIEHASSLRSSWGANILTAFLEHTTLQALCEDDPKSHKIQNIAFENRPSVCTPEPRVPP